MDAPEWEEITSIDGDPGKAVKTFTTPRKFTDYKEINMEVPCCITHNLSVVNNGLLKAEGDLTKIIQQKTLRKIVKFKFFTYREISTFNFLFF